MGPPRLNSADSHVIEPPDLWTTRVEAKFKERAPRVVSEEKGDHWYIDGQRGMSVNIGADPGGVRKAQRATEARVSNVIAGGYDPEARIKDLDADGVFGEVVFPTIGFTTYYLVQDSQLLHAICRTYNDWLVDFCSEFPHRLKGVGMLTLDDMGEGVKELHRIAKMGLSDALIPCYPGESQPYHQPKFEPFWAAAHDLGVNLHLHINTVRDPAKLPPPAPDLRGGSSWVPMAFYWVQRSIIDLVLSGVFERYPKLRVVSDEFELAPFVPFATIFDADYKRHGRRGSEQRFKNHVVPSDFLRRNVWITFQDDRFGILHRSSIGVDNIMWGSDYPHVISTFPNSREIVDENFAGIPEEEKAKIVCDNAARVFGFV